jgi:hypothetical protein
MVSDSIRRQSKQIFQNIENIFGAVSEESMGSTVGVFPLWKQIYHLLHSMDQHFIDPADFSEPVFHTKNLNVIFLDMGDPLSRGQLINYYKQVRAKLEAYLRELTDAALNETIRFRDMEPTRLELLLAQFRHIFYHVGYLHCCLKLINGETPVYAGLYEAVPEK